MTDLLKTYVDKINVTTNIPLQLPKLKKVNEGNSLPKLTLPKLNKIEA
jgi:hypothetical protein